MGGIMNISKTFRILLVAIGTVVIGIVIFLIRGASFYAKADKPPEVIRGGIWTDHFYNPQFVTGINYDVQMSHLILKYDEQLHWIQTWTAHFDSGEFDNTVAISDSVRLAPDGMGQYFISGTYTSTVFFAAKPVDWASTGWNYSGLPEEIEVKFRTGNTPVPDLSWTNWQLPIRIFNEFICWYTYNTEETGCITNMSGIESSSYIQYRASFLSQDPKKTVALYDIDFLYGTHPITGTALSTIIPPVDLRAWDSLIITSTIPALTTLVIDIATPDGEVLAHDVHNGDDLSWIDPIEHPALQLLGRFSTTDESLTPDVDLWGIKWLVMNNQYLPVVYR
jgi:hypothetical protein